MTPRWRDLRRIHHVPYPRLEVLLAEPSSTGSEIS